MRNLVHKDLGMKSITHHQHHPEEANAGTWREAHFWRKEMWPPQSLDLNPLDYSIWSVLLERVQGTSHPNMESLNAHIAEASGRGFHRQRLPVFPETSGSRYQCQWQLHRVRLGRKPVFCCTRQMFWPNNKNKCALLQSLSEFREPPELNAHPVECYKTLKRDIFLKFGMCIVDTMFSNMLHVFIDIIGF